MYEQLLNNEQFLNLMKEIGNKKFITDGKWDWEHGIGHVTRVSLYVENILNQLNADKRTIELGMLAALLHDIGLINGDKGNHALDSSIMFEQYINDITEEEKEIIRQAIEDHSKGDNIKSLVGMALLLADKLDVTYHRTVDSSIQDEMNKEIQKIRKVTIDIDDKNLIVTYYINDNIDINILNGWDKMFTIPKKVSEYLNKEYKFETKPIY